MASIPAPVRTLTSSATEAKDREIDHLVYELYGLTDDAFGVL
jgi:hypothetical protein